MSNRHPAPAEHFETRIPEGDDRHRLVCRDCGFVDYRNPKIVVGVVAEWQGRILMCRRAIEPQRGLWTLPAGYLEQQEGAAEGAVREAWEEARAELEIDQLLAVYSIQRISQVQLIYRARLTRPEVAAGPESLEVALFAPSEIPRGELAFPSVHWALDHFEQARGRSGFAPFSNPPESEGSGPLARDRF